ncbi:MAG: transaldolase family protein, partial [Demequina sp.]
MTNRLETLSDAGVSIWLDDLNRERLRSGTLAADVKERSIVGVTSNPTIFAGAIGHSDDYDQQLRDLTARGVGVEEAVRMLTTADVREACDILAPVYERTGGVDGRVSIEVDPRFAHDTDATIAEARQLHWLVDRPNVMIKIPATKEGIPAIRAV